MRGQLRIPLEARARYRLAPRQSIGSARIYGESTESGHSIESNERCTRRSVSTPRGNYPFRTFKRKPVANTNAARHEISEDIARKKTREETRRWKGWNCDGEGGGGGRKGKEETVAVWLAVGSAREAGKGVIRVKLGSPWFPWIPAGYLRRGSTRGRMNGRTDGRNERQPATARVSSDASPHLSVRI